MRALTLTLTLTLVLSACGFHLAGSRPLPEPLKQVYIDVVVPYLVSEPPVETALRNLLQRRGAKVVGEPKDARTLIRLSELNEGRQVLSLGPDGKALEYQLITSVRYVVQSGDQVLLGPDVLRVTRDYSFNAQQVLAKEAEEERLRDFIQGELAELLILRIDAALSRAALTTGSAPAATPDAPPAP